MFKIFIILLILINIFACEPIKQAANNKSKQQVLDFTCLTSQHICDVNTELGQFTIHFAGESQQGKIKTELPFQIKLSFNSPEESTQIKKITSYLEGKSMFMGKVPVFFQNEPKNTMLAESLLASCSEEIMTWRLWFQIEINADGKIHQQDFFVDFDSVRL